MFINRQPRLAVFDKVTKFNSEEEPPTLIFGDLSFSLPTERKVAVLGRRESGRTTLLQILNGQLNADSGGVVTKTKFSPILNSKSYLHPGMTGIENVKSLARMYGLREDRMIKFVITLPGVTPSAWNLPVNEVEARDRRSMEMLLAAILPYECYLIDDIEKVDQNTFLLMAKLVGARKAGIIFTTFNPKYARQYGDCAGVIANYKLYLFGTPGEAENFYDR